MNFDTFHAKTKLVRSIFSGVSSNYDRMNSVMSAGLHKRWKKNFCSLIRLANSGTYLDLACGTGDISALLLDKAKQEGKSISLTMCDPSTEMLNIAKSNLFKAHPEQSIQFESCSAEELTIVSQSTDTIITSFGIRNFTDPESSLKNISESLKKHGEFYCMDFFSDTNSLLKTPYNIYLAHIIPKLGKYVANNEEAYTYFANSIQGFYSKENFKELILRSGFEFCNYKSYFFDIIGLFYAKKCLQFS